MKMESRVVRFSDVIWKGGAPQRTPRVGNLLAQRRNKFLVQIGMSKAPAAE